jgi:hypothetical protein
LNGREKLRLQYRPGQVKLLFIGESPPASGRFFYQADSGLYRAIRDTFQVVDPSITDSNFLDVFQGLGCYLIDLCGRPVDQLEPDERRVACHAGEARLARTITELQPREIVVMVRSIRRNVERAVLRSGWQGPVLELPYPGRWVRHRERFQEGLVPTLRSNLI